MPDLPFDTLLHIGAGSGAAVQDWMEAGARRIILVEPNPAHAAALARLAAANPQIEVIEAAITDQDGEGYLHVFNLARHSSLADASGLAQLLPGLRQTALIPVTTLTPAALMNRLPPEPGNIRLTLDAPGSEMQILRGFMAAGALQQLAVIDLICTEEAQYAGAVGRPVLQSLLEDAGFTLASADLSDPDWPRLTFQIDQNARQIASLRAALGEAQAMAGLLARQLAEEKSAAVELASDNQDRVAALLHQHQVVVTLTAELAASRAEVDGLHLALAEVESSSAGTQQDIAILRNALEAAQSERFSAARQIEMLERLLAEAQTAQSSDAAALQRQTRLMDEARERSDMRIRTLDAALAERDTALAAAVAERAALTLQLQRLREAQSAASPDQDHTIARQNDRIKQLEHRQNLARDELRRSEGQLELIKDLLLRGDRL